MICPCSLYANVQFFTQRVEVESGPVDQLLAVGDWRRIVQSHRFHSLCCYRCGVR